MARGLKSPGPAGHLIDQHPGARLRAWTGLLYQEVHDIIRRHRLVIGVITLSLSAVLLGERDNLIVDDHLESSSTMARAKFDGERPPEPPRPPSVDRLPIHMEFDRHSDERLADANLPPPWPRFNKSWSATAIFLDLLGRF
jgi:hypothetical protein